MQKINKTILGFTTGLIEVQIFTDGSCYPNPSEAGGWAYIIKYITGNVVKNSGASRESNTTNNRMELTAAIEGLRALDHKRHTVELVTDSEYVGKGIALWMDGWCRSGWRIKNADLWKQLYDFSQFHKIYVTCIRGHTGQEENEECDRMADAARKKNVRVSDTPGRRPRIRRNLKSTR